MLRFTLLGAQALDSFNTAVVSPIYYVTFTSLTIVASVIMFKVSYSIKSETRIFRICMNFDGLFGMNVHIIVIYSSLNVEMQDWAGQTATNVVSEICGFLTILSGTILLHSTKESSDSRRSGISKCYKKSLVFITSKCYIFVKCWNKNP